jgi:hypothetical protein
MGHCLLTKYRAQFKNKLNILNRLFIKELSSFHEEQNNECAWQFGL